MLRAVPIVAALVLSGLPAAAQPGAPPSGDCPRFEDYRCMTDVHMRRGTDTIVYRGVITQAHPGYTYRFKARAGQVLTWDVNGPATRQVIGYPDGGGDGPGIPNRIPLPQTGVYTFTVSANLMAEGAFGPFTLRLTIR